MPAPPCTHNSSSGGAQPQLRDGLMHITASRQTQSGMGALVGPRWGPWGGTEIGATAPTGPWGDSCPQAVVQPGAAGNPGAGRAGAGSAAGGGRLGGPCVHVRWGCCRNHQREELHLPGVSSSPGPLVPRQPRGGWARAKEQRGQAGLRVGLCKGSGVCFGPAEGGNTGGCWRSWGPAARDQPGGCWSPPPAPAGSCWSGLAGAHGQGKWAAAPCPPIVSGGEAPPWPGWRGHTVPWLAALSSAACHRSLVF